MYFLYHIVKYFEKMIASDKNYWNICTIAHITLNLDGTQYSGNIPECSFSVALFGTSREHLGNILKEKIFKKIHDEKVVFVLKVYHLIITNVDLLVNSSNQYSRNIPRIFVSKIFQEYPQNIV